MIYCPFDTKFVYSQRENFSVHYPFHHHFQQFLLEKGPQEDHLILLKIKFIFRNYFFANVSKKKRVKNPYWIKSIG